MCRFWQYFCKKMTYILDFSTNHRIYFFLILGVNMIDIFDSEAIVKVYRLLNKKCNAIDIFIKNHAYCFSTNTYEYSAVDVCNNIIDLMARKNQLINFKIIVDNAISRLNEEDKKILYVKMNYSISMEEFCAVLHFKERTAFRKIERAFKNLADTLNNSKYIDKLTQILTNEEWIANVKQEVKERRMAFKNGVISI